MLKILINMKIEVGIVYVIMVQYLVLWVGGNLGSLKINLVLKFSSIYVAY